MAGKRCTCGRRIKPDPVDIPLPKWVEPQPPSIRYELERLRDKAPRKRVRPKRKRKDQA